MFEWWWLNALRPHHPSLLALFRAVPIHVEAPVVMHDTMWHRGEKATVLVTDRHTGVAETWKCLMNDFMDLTFVFLCICILPGWKMISGIPAWNAAQTLQVVSLLSLVQRSTSSPTFKIQPARTHTHTHTLIALVDFILSRFKKQNKKSKWPSACGFQKGKFW